MFIQVIQGQVIDAEELRRSMDQWLSDLAPGASGWQGSILFLPACRARFLVETLRSPCMRTTNGAWVSSSIISVFTTECSGTPSASDDTDVPPFSTYS